MRVESDYQGWSNWETWNTSLMLDNDYDTYKKSRELFEKGMTVEQLQDFLLRKVIGPYNRERIRDAKEWNSIPREERIDPHWEELKEKSPGAADLVNAFGMGEDIEDDEPELIDPDLVNWQEIWDHLYEEIEGNQEYDRTTQGYKDQGLSWVTNHDLMTNQMRDAFYRYHGAIPEEELEAMPGSQWENPGAYHNIRVTTPWEQAKDILDGSLEGHVTPETRMKIWDYQNKMFPGMGHYEKSHAIDWEQDPTVKALIAADPNIQEYAKNGYTKTLSDLTWQTINAIHRSQPTPYADVMRKALEQRGYTPEQIEEMFQPQWRWQPNPQYRDPNAPMDVRTNPGDWINLSPKMDQAEIDRSLDQPGDLTLPEGWGTLSKTARQVEVQLSNTDDFFLGEQGEPVSKENFAALNPQVVNAYVDQRPVGSAVFFPLTEPEMLAMIPLAEARLDPVMWVEWIYVDPEYRDSNVFNSLALAVKEAADQAGLPIKAFFQNPQLQRVIERYFKRAQVDDPWDNVFAGDWTEPDATQHRRPFVIDFEDIDNPDPPIWIGDPGQYHDESPLYNVERPYYGEIWEHTDPPVIQRSWGTDDVYDDIAKAQAERYYYQQRDLKKRAGLRRFAGFFVVADTIDEIAERARQNLYNREDLVNMRSRFVDPLGKLPPLPDFGYDNTATTPELISRGYIENPKFNPALYKYIEAMTTRHLPPELYKFYPWVTKQIKNQAKAGGGEYPWGSTSHLRDILTQGWQHMEYLRSQPPGSPNHAPVPDIGQMDYPGLENWVYERNKLGLDVRPGVQWEWEPKELRDRGEVGPGVDTENTYLYPIQQQQYDVGDGWKVWPVYSANDLKREGDMMGHCVGGYCNSVHAGSSIIFSLRDPKGEPHATIELEPDNENGLNVVQIQGKQNTDPAPEYKARVRSFFDQLKAEGYGIHQHISIQDTNDLQEYEWLSLPDSEGYGIDVDSDVDCYNLARDLVDDAESGYVDSSTENALDNLLDAKIIDREELGSEIRFWANEKIEEKQRELREDWEYRKDMFEREYEQAKSEYCSNRAYEEDKGYDEDDEDYEAPDPDDFEDEFPSFDEYMEEYHYDEWLAMQGDFEDEAESELSDVVDLRYRYGSASAMWHEASDGADYWTQSQDDWWGTQNDSLFNVNVPGEAPGMRSDEQADSLHCPHCMGPMHGLKCPSCGFERTAGLTQNQKRQEMKRLEEVYGPDQSEIVYTHPSGHSIRRQTRRGDVARAGRLLNNCWAQADCGRRYDDEEVGTGYRNHRYTLNDPMGYPIGAFFVDPKNDFDWTKDPTGEITHPAGTTTIHNGLGHGNTPLKPEYFHVIKSWADTIPDSNLGYFNVKAAGDMAPSGQVHVMPEEGRDEWGEGGWDTDTFLDHRMLNKSLREQQQAEQYLDYMKRHKRAEDATWPTIGIKEADATLAPVMPDLNYVLDYEPGENTDTGWQAHTQWLKDDPYWYDHIRRMNEGMQTMTWPESEFPQGTWSPAGLTWKQAQDYLLKRCGGDGPCAQIAQATPNEPFYARTDTIEWVIEKTDASHFSKHIREVFASVYHDRPREPRQHWPRLAGFFVTADNIEELADKAYKRLADRPDIVKMREEYEESRRVAPNGDAPYDLDPAVRSVGAFMNNIRPDVRGVPAETYKMWEWLIGQFKRGNANWWENNAHIRDILTQATKWMQWCDEHHVSMPDWKRKDFTFDDMQAWVYEMNGKDVQKDVGWENEKVIYEWPDGWYMSEVSEHDCALEGELMGHCVGGYGYQISSGASYIVSLRDPKGHPHVTLEMEGTPPRAQGAGYHNSPTEWEVQQIQGKQDREPIEEYQERIKEWFNSLKEQGYDIKWSRNSVQHGGEYGYEEPEYLYDEQTVVNVQQLPDVLDALEKIREEGMGAFHEDYYHDDYGRSEGWDDKYDIGGWIEVPKVTPASVVDFPGHYDTGLDYLLTLWKVFIQEILQGKIDEPEEIADYVQGFYFIVETDTEHQRWYNHPLTHDRWNDNNGALNTWFNAAKEAVQTFQMGHRNDVPIAPQLFGWGEVDPKPRPEAMSMANYAMDYMRALFAGWHELQPGRMNSPYYDSPDVQKVVYPKWDKPTDLYQDQVLQWGEKGAPYGQRPDTYVQLTQPRNWGRGEIAPVVTPPKYVPHRYNDPYVVNRNPPQVKPMPVVTKTAADNVPGMPVSDSGHYAAVHVLPGNDEYGDWQEGRAPLLYHPNTDTLYIGQVGSHHGLTWEDFHKKLGQMPPYNEMIEGDFYPNAIPEYDVPARWVIYEQADPESGAKTGTPEEQMNMALKMKFHKPLPVYRGMNQFLAKTAADNVPGMPVSDSGHWVWLDGKVGFGGAHHEIAERLADELGYEPGDKAYVSNWLARGHCPQDRAVAVGTFKNNRPYIWNSTRDRNHIWDAVMQARETD